MKRKITSMDCGTPFNRSRYPVVDETGTPFTPGCRVSFVVPAGYINREHGTGTLVAIDEYGGLTIHSDNPVKMPDGIALTLKTDFYTVVQKFHYDGPLAGKIVTKSSVGDRHEHGEYPIFVRNLEKKPTRRSKNKAT